MNVKLKVVGGKHDGQGIAVPGPKFFIGRAEDCQLRPGSEMVSRHHCVLLLENGFLAVRDFGSKNGTFVNGERVKAERELQAGDKLRVGPLEFEVVTEVNVGGRKKPKVRSIEEAVARTAESIEPDDDIDLFDLLGEETDEETAANETQSIPAPDTKSEAPPATQRGGASGPTETTPAESTTPNIRFDLADDATEQQPKKKPEPPKPSTESSRSAADDLLRQLFNQK